MPDILAGLTLRDLEYAVAVDRARHFGRAAAACQVSQPALSGQIRKLETLLGTQLFERRTRDVVPTPHGALLLRRAEQVLAEARALMNTARRPDTPLAGPLHLGAIETLGPYYLPTLVRGLRAAYPALVLRLSEQRTDALLDQVRAGLLDVALVALPVRADWSHSEPLFFEPFRLACPAGHKLATGEAVPLSDLAGQDLLLLEEGHCLRDQALQLCQTSGRAGATRHATSVETLWHMIAAGEGYSVMPVLALRNRDDLDGLVVTRPLRDETDHNAGEAVGRTIGLVWRATDPRGPEYPALAAVLRAGLPDSVRPVLA